MEWNVYHDAATGRWYAAPATESVSAHETDGYRLTASHVEAETEQEARDQYAPR